MTSLKAADLFHVNGLVAVVTGGGSGIGSYIACALAANGAKRVFITGRRLDKLQYVANKYPDIIKPLQGDVTSKEDLIRLAGEVRADTPYINLLVANAGVNDRSALEMGENPTLEIFQDFLCGLPREDWSRVLDVNVTSAVYSVAHFLDLLKAGNDAKNVPYSSQVIATSAIGAFIRSTPPGGFAYVASKAAITHVFKTLATMMAPYKIRSNIICPGLYHSEMADPIIDSIQQSGGDAITKLIPEGRVGTIEDMTGVILFLASKAGSFCSGNVLVSDGGTMSLEPATY
ncbi:hypothetical protein F5884DRAFT_309889 [Xylogone sp. PMI_703]|nr:hypothetical protein F5884DRAFT_309889 [Xylogone sp. PMI_703]